MNLPLSLTKVFPSNKSVNMVFKNVRFVKVDKNAWVEESKEMPLFIILNDELVNIIQLIEYGLHHQKRQKNQQVCDHDRT